MDSKNKNNLVIVVGLGLILLVALVTVFRFGKKDSEPQKKEIQSEKIDVSNLISAQDFKKRIRNRESLRIIDIRDKDSFAIEHIPNSLNVPLEELPVKELTDDGNPIVVIDYDGKNGIQAIKILKDKKLKNILFLSGGILSWKEINGSTISWGDPSSFTDQAKVTFISADDLKKDFDNNTPLIIIDVRDSKSFTQGKIPKALNIPLSELESNREKISNGKQIIVYGETELEGFQAGVRLYDLNFFAVKTLSGGFKDWKAKGFQTER